jgi:hypothetical protein
LLLAQLRSLDMGLVSRAQELACLVRQKLETTASDEGLASHMALSSLGVESQSPADFLTQLNELDAHIDELLGMSSESGEKAWPTRSVVEMRKAVLSDFGRKHLVPLSHLPVIPRAFAFAVQDQSTVSVVQTAQCTLAQ